MKRYALTVLLWLSPMAAMADGNDLLIACQMVINTQDNQTKLGLENSFGSGYCLGVITTVATLARDMPAYLKSCPPAGIPGSQGVRVVLKWLKDNPSVLNLEPAYLTSAAFRAAFPCK